MLNNKNEDIKKPAKVISLSQAKSSPTVDKETIQANSIAAPEISRALLAYPLVVRDGDGTFMSAGGKSVGKVSLNDIKAMLAQAYQTPANFVQRWEQRADGLWVVMEQNNMAEVDARSCIEINLKEINSTRGVGVLEIMQYFFNKESRHPVEFCSFVFGIGK